MEPAAKIWRTPGLGEVFMATTNKKGFQAVIRHDNPRLPAPAIDRLYEASGGWPTKRAVLKLLPRNACVRIRRPKRAATPAGPAGVA